MQGHTAYGILSVVEKLPLKIESLDVWGAHHAALLPSASPQTLSLCYLSPRAMLFACTACISVRP